MTSRSLRSRPTTAWNTLRAIRSNGRAISGAALVMLFSLSAIAEETAAPDGPLDRLRERSAEARWQQQRHQWIAPSVAASDERPVSDSESDSGQPSGAEPAPANPSADPDLSDILPGSAVPARPDSAEAASSLRVLDLFLESDTAVRAARSDREPIASHPGGAVVDTHAAAVTTAEPGPDHASVLPLPEFLAGAEPSWIARPPAATAHRVQRARTLGRAGSQLIAVQSQIEESPNARARGVLRPITEINPFFDYDPDGGDPCEHLCPVPTAFCNTDDFLCPVEEPLPVSGSSERYFAHMNYFWAASDVYYNPLYFEDPALERYGHVHCHDAVQPIFSMARFGGQLIGLPYQMALYPVHNHVYPLGYYRPGDPAPKLIYQVPLNARAAATAAGVYTGFFLLVP